MSGSGTNFNGGRELEKLRQSSPLVGSLISRLIDAVNRGFKNLGGAAGELPAPPPVDQVNVKGSVNATTNTLTVPSEILHWTHTHNSPLERGIQYVTEIDTDPSFSNPHPLSQHTSRSGFHPMPANDDNGDPVDYYLRVTAQYPNGKPSTPTVFGTAQGPTKINFTGTTNMSLLESQAAGTARPGQGGKGLGPVQSRSAVGGPKRALDTPTKL